MISQKTLQHPILTLITFALLGILGLFTLSNVAISLLPETDMPYLMVTASYPNSGPESVEKSVTTVLENTLVSLNNLKSITSTSSEGSCTVSLEFNYGTDLEVATNDVRDKLDRVKRSLPDSVTPTIMKMNGSSQSIMRIALRGNRSADDLKLLAENTVADVLEQASGVGEASVMGGRTKIVRVELELNRLQAYGLTLSTVSSVLARQNLELGGGSLTEGKTSYSIRTTGEYTSIAEINNTVIQTVNGYDVKLSDIGTAFIGYQDASSEVYINGQPGIYISVSKQSGENSVTVANAVYEKIETVKTLLPSDVTLEVVSDSTESIRSTINTLIESAWQGLLLAVVILYVFLCSFKSTIIIAISIPLSILITLLCMNFAGITLNLMTLTGLILGVGMIVDASVVMIDNIYAYRSRGTKAKVAAILGSEEMIMSVFSGNLTTICVFIPFLFYIKDLGYMGQMFKGLIFTIVIALLSSLFVAIFLVPVLAGYFFPITNRNEKPVKSFFFRTLYAIFTKVQDIITVAYRFALKAALAHRAITVLICVTALIISFLFIPTLKITMMTGGRDSSVTLSIQLPLGTPLEETSAVVNAFEQIVEQEVVGYKNIIMSIGSGGRGSNSNRGSIEITLPDDPSQSDSPSQIQAKLRKHFAEFTDVNFSFGRGFRQQLTGDDLDIVVRASSLDKALEVSNNIIEVMKQIPDIGEPALDTTEGLPQVEIQIDRERAYNFGLNVNTVANEIQANIEGKSSTVYRNNGEDYSVYVMLRPDDIEKVSDLEQIYVQGSKGLVSLGSFAKVIKGTSPVSIRHENRTRIVHITAGILSNENANVVEQKIKDGISNSFIIPDGVSVSYEGSWKDINDQYKVYLYIALMAIILVFGVMAATYESFKAPIINLTTIPFLVIGVVGIYKITGQVVSMMSAIGLIMLVGIVVNNGIILVDYTNLLIGRGRKKLDACLEAGTSRLRPVLMTTLTTILGMMPMCLATEGSATMVQPIGVAVVGGLVSSTFITMFFIPVFYSLIMNEKKVVKSRIKIEENITELKQEADEIIEPLQGRPVELLREEILALNAPFDVDESEDSVDSNEDDFWDLGEEQKDSTDSKESVEDEPLDLDELQEDQIDSLEYEPITQEEPKETSSEQEPIELLNTPIEQEEPEVDPIDLLDDEPLDLDELQEDQIDSLEYEPITQEEPNEASSEQEPIELLNTPIEQEEPEVDPMDLLDDEPIDLDESFDLQEKEAEPIDSLQDESSDVEEENDNDDEPVELGGIPLDLLEDDDMPQAEEPLQEDSTDPEQNESYNLEDESTDGDTEDDELVELDDTLIDDLDDEELDLPEEPVKVIPVKAPSQTTVQTKPVAQKQIEPVLPKVKIDTSSKQEQKNQTVPKGKLPPSEAKLATPAKKASLLKAATMQQQPKKEAVLPKKEVKPNAPQQKATKPFATNTYYKLDRYALAKPANPQQAEPVYAPQATSKVQQGHQTVSTPVEKPATKPIEYATTQAIKPSIMVERQAQKASAKTKE